MTVLQSRMRRVCHSPLSAAAAAAGASAAERMRCNRHKHGPDQLNLHITQHAEPSARLQRGVRFIKTLDKVKLASQMQAGAGAGPLC